MDINKKKTALLSNVTVGLIAGKLRGKYDFYIPEGFDTWIQDIVDPSSGLYTEKPDVIVVLLDGTETRAWKDREEAAERTGSWKLAVRMLADRFGSVPLFVSTVDIRENRIKALSERRFRTELENDWYQFIQGLADERSNVYILDLADLAADIGRKQFYSDKMWYMSSMPWSREGLAAIASELEKVLNSAFDARKKIIALDLDNTLWGGVAGEDGLAGVELSDHKEGQRFYDFQRQLLEMKNRGIVLAVDSKNNEEDAEDIIRNHPAMLLRDGDFVSRKINWKDKASNLKEMEQELNITEGGFVFIDDNPVEREIVKGECPEVYVPEFPKDTTGLLEFAEELWADKCRPLRVLGEDRNKTQMYLSEAGRRQELGESLNLDDYISRLGMRAEIHPVRPDELDRAAQLAGKTNQFNVTTKRYTKAQIEEIAGDPKNMVYTVHSGDKYGDSGLISLVILTGCGDGMRIDTFLMSCRVMGRKLENVIVNELAARMNGKPLYAEYIPTAKNVPVRELYDRLGFEKLSEEDGRRSYVLNTEGYKKQVFDSYKEIIFEDSPAKSAERSE